MGDYITGIAHGALLGVFIIMTLAVFGIIQPPVTCTTNEDATLTLDTEFDPDDIPESVTTCKITFP